MDPRAFVPPMLAAPAPAAFSDPDWWFEPKWDGFRAQLSVTDRIRIRSRQGTSLLDRFPALGAAAEAVAGPAVLDGEVVAWHEGRVDFHALTAGRGQLVLVLFDCLYDRSGWLVSEPWTVRREHLEAAVHPAGSVMLCQGTVGRGEELFRATGCLGLEGVVAKRRGSRYWPGRRTSEWRKVVHTAELRVEVRALATQGGQWLADVGAVGQRPVLARVRVPAVPPGVVPPPEGERRELPPGIWATVQYRARTPQGRLRHAVFRSYGGDGW